MIIVPADVLTPNGAKPSGGTLPIEKLHITLSLSLGFSDYVSPSWTKMI